MTRTGKIARLPRDIRNQLNQRLQDGELGTRLVEWLNSLPDTQRVLATDFGNREINEQNMSDWKAGGYADWLARQETLACARELAADAGELMEAAGGSLADHLAMTLSARYAALVAGWNGEMDDEFRRKVRALRLLCQDIVELRRGDHNAERLRLDLEKFADAKEAEDQRALDLLAAEIKQWPDVSKALAEVIVLYRQKKNGTSGNGQGATEPMGNQAGSR